MGLAPLIAPAGSLTVASRVAAFTWGSWDVTWPEGFNAPEPPADDRALGFIAKLGTEPARFGRDFVRADATVDAVERVSNVERILDAAEKRVSGDVSFSRDIETAGLVGQVPGVDFRVGDLVPIRVWNRVLPDQLVTKITQVGEVGEPVGWRVHVGDQLVSDSDALVTASSEVERTVAKERRERRGAVAQVSQVASAARSTAESAQVDASAALSEVRDKKGVIQGYVEQAEAAVAAGREHNAQAAKRLEESRTVLEGATSKLAAAEKLLDESDLTLEANRKLKAAVESYKAGIEKLLVEARTLNAGVRQSTAAAAAHGAQALAILSETEDLHTQVAGLLEEAAQQVKQGKQHLEFSRRLAQAGEAARADAVAAAEKAARLAGEAETALTSVKGEREQVAKILADVQVQKQAADKALTDAGGVLSQAKKAAQDAGTSKDAVDALYRQVVDKHGEVLNLHGEMIQAQADINAKQQVILEAHSEAISLTAKGVRALAGSQAAMAGALAYFEQCLEASNKAIEAVAEATELNTQAITRLDEIAKLHEEAIREQAAMTEQLRIATEKLAATDADIIQTQTNLKDSQALIQTQTENNTKALAITNRAVRAHGGAIGGMAASISLLQESQEETQKATEQALSATQSNTGAIKALEAVGRARDEAVSAATEAANRAGEVATGARAIALAAKYAADVNAVAVRNNKKRDSYLTDNIQYIWDYNRMTTVRIYSRESGSKKIICNDDYDKYFAPDTRAGLRFPSFTVRGKWSGHGVVYVTTKSGLTDYGEIWINEGKISTYPSFVSITDGGTRAEFRLGLSETPRWIRWEAHPSTLPDGSEPKQPSPPTYEPVPKIPSELTQQ